VYWIRFEISKKLYDVSLSFPRKYIEYNQDCGKGLLGITNIEKISEGG